MQPSHKLQNFRKQIRREQLDSLFSSRRIKLVESISTNQNNEQGMDIEKQKQQTSLRNINNDKVSVEQLRTVAKLSQSEAGIDIIHKSQIQGHLWKYLTEKYSESEEQYYSSYILCNLYYEQKSVPSQTLAQCISNLMDQADMRTLQNVLFLLNNVLSNCNSWLDVIINNYNFIDRLAALFKRFEKPTINYLVLTIQLVFKCLRIHLNCKDCKDCREFKLECTNCKDCKERLDERFLKLKVPLTKLVMQKQSEDSKELIKKSSHCYYFLVRYYPNAMCQSLVKFGILAKFIGMTSFYSEKKYTQMVLEIIEFSLHQIPQQMVQTTIIPYLISLANINFELGDNSKIVTARNVKIQTYRVIRLLLQSYKLKIDYFGSCKLGEIMMDEFQTSQDRQILLVLSYNFVQVYLNTSTERLKEIIVRLIKRAWEYNRDDYEFGNFLHEFNNPL